MIKCKPYRATFMTDKTCRAKLKKLKPLLKWTKQRRESGRTYGNIQILESTPPNSFFEVMGCASCQSGLALLEIMEAESRLEAAQRKKSGKPTKKPKPKSDMRSKRFVGF